jgi:hypothetical protein
MVDKQRLLGGCNRQPEFSDRAVGVEESDKSLGRQEAELR